MMDDFITNLESIYLSLKNINWLLLSVFLFGGIIRNGTPYLFVSLGECVTERAGRVNLGLEGTLFMGAMSGYGVSYLVASSNILPEAYILSFNVWGDLSFYYEFQLASWLGFSPLGLSVFFSESSMDFCAICRASISWPWASP